MPNTLLPAACLFLLATGMPAHRTEVFFEADFEKSPIDLHSTWKIEGGGHASVDQGWLHLREKVDGEGLVLWLRRDVPADFRLQLSVKFSNNRGIGVFFMAASATGGGDAFADTQPRTGAYDEYIRGDLDSYSLSLHRYWPDGRNNPGSNLRRNSGFHLLSQALPDPILEAERAYRVRIDKVGGHLRVWVDGNPVHEAFDTGEHGPVLGAGKIGFRLRGDPSCIMMLDDIRIDALKE